jgi:50S ribosomal protein L16 3-hydroxylase
MTLHNFDPASFLRDYWQRRPLLIRAALPGFVNPVEPDELAGLACEDDVESRIVTGADGTWAMEAGPFTDDRFADLAGPWTLLVQAVDHQIQPVADLLQMFRFVPDWRIDDVMVSYASDGGGVGPHFDRYDVFLIQGLGRRRWRIGQRCTSTTPLLPHPDLCLLGDLEVTDEWVLEPGDILYVPPGVAHDGVAVGDDCMTYSVGFRAPARAELISSFADEVLEHVDEDDLFRDSLLTPQDNPGEIAPDALARLQAMVVERMADPAHFARWFGSHISAPKYPDVDWRPEENLSADGIRQAIADGLPLLRNPASRFAFIRQGGGAVLLFADGASFACTGEGAVLAERLCANPSTTLPPLDESAIAMLAALHDQGSVAFDSGD